MSSPRPAPDPSAHTPGTVDVHQHFWPAELVEALRARGGPPLLRGWELQLAGEPAYAVRPEDHALAPRLAQEAGSALSLVSLSSPLGIEDLPPDDATPLLEAWHAGAARLPAPFGAWAAVTRLEPDLAGLRTLLGRGFVGLQVPATWLAGPAELERLAPVLAVCELADRPVLVHPGPVPGDRDRSALPGWWPAVADYPAQLQAAWWAWHVAGRDLLPRLRIGFVAAAGLAPLQHERLRARGGDPGPGDPGVFVETSSYGPQVVQALVKALGTGAVISGSDRPYAEPLDFEQPGFTLESTAAEAISITNSRNFLTGPIGG